MTTKCPKCCSENPDTQRFCGECGTQLFSAKDIPLSQTETLHTPVRELTTGVTLADRYQVIEELGRGGMGRVYKVFDTEIHEKIALKLLKAEIAENPEIIERFRNELKLARKIRHKNVCGMFDIGEAEGAYFITMEYVAGEDLKSLIRMSRQLAAGTAISIAKQVCEGLAEAHRLGVVHRDLKPSNFMIDKDGNARIMDFGIARSVQAKGITGADIIIGTPEYMSPEQAEAKDVDKRSDIYSLGVILYEMATGRVPFEGETPLSIVMKHKSETPQDPAELNAQIPLNLDRVILRCLEKDAAKRYQSVEELHSELTRIEQQIPVTERTIPKRKPTKSREMVVEEGRSKRSKTALYTGLVVVLALIVYGGLKLFSGRSGAIDSIAVLPFENANADPNIDYLCDGITETIINKLSQLSNLKKVISRNSVFAYKGKFVDPKKVGQELDVKAVLLTRLVRVGDMLTVSPTLVRTRDNSQLWGERYNRKFDDIFALEDDIATSVIQALRLKLSGEDRQKISKRPIDNVSAYECYLKAYHEIWRYNEKSLNRAIGYLQEGLDIMGDNAFLYSGLALAYWQLVNIGAGQENFIAKVEENANKALALDPNSPQAHRILGRIASDFRGNPREFLRQIKQALAVNPNEPDALLDLAFHYIAILGKVSRALPLIEKIKKVDPLNIRTLWIQGSLYFYGGEYRLALEPYQRWYQSDPENPLAALRYAWTLAYNNRLDEAFSIIDQSAKTAPDNVFTKFGLLLKYGLLKNKEKAFQEMTPDFQTTCKRDPGWSVFVAAALAVLGEKKEALDWLENAVDRGNINYPFFAEKDSFLTNIRGEERFKKLMERVKYDWEHFAE